jgi:hypothetical protein
MGVPEEKDAGGDGVVEAKISEEELIEPVQQQGGRGQGLNRVDLKPDQQRPGKVKQCPDNSAADAKAMMLFVGMGV